MIKYNFDRHFKIEENCIDIIEYELNCFFDSRLELVLSISDWYMQGSIKNAKNLLTHLKITDEEINDLMKVIHIRIYGEIANARRKSMLLTNINIEAYLQEMKQYVDRDLSEALKTDQIAGICEYLINNFISVIIDTACKGKLSGSILGQYNYAAKLLNHNSHKKQQHKHGEIILRQAEGFLLNMKTELRNELVRASLSMIASCHNIYEDSIVA